jgi:hypothetical protein
MQNFTADNVPLSQKPNPKGGSYSKSSKYYVCMFQPKRTHLAGRKRARTRRFMKMIAYNIQDLIGLDPPHTPCVT